MNDLREEERRESWAGGGRVGIYLFSIQVDRDTLFFAERTSCIACMSLPSLVSLPNPLSPPLLIQTVGIATVFCATTTARRTLPPPPAATYLTLPAIPCRPSPVVLLRAGTSSKSLTALHWTCLCLGKTFKPLTSNLSQF